MFEIHSEHCEAHCSLRQLLAWTRFSLFKKSTSAYQATNCTTTIRDVLVLPFYWFPFLSNDYWRKPPVVGVSFFAIITHFLSGFHFAFPHFRLSLFRLYTSSVRATNYLGSITDFVLPLPLFPGVSGIESFFDLKFGFRFQSCGFLW